MNEKTFICKNCFSENTLIKSEELRTFLCLKYGIISCINLFAEETELGKWCDEQRKAYREGNLTQRQIDKLNEIDFPWEG